MSEGEPPNEPLAARGSLSGAPERTLLRLIETVTLVGPIRSLLSLGARLLLGYRRIGELSVSGEELLLAAEVRVFGARLRRSLHRFRLDAIRELTLLSGKSELEFAAGLIPLTLGTVLGVSLMSRGALTPDGAPGLVGLGALVVLLGLGIDALKAGLLRRTDPPRPRAQLLVRPEAQRGFVLSLPEAEARSLLLLAAQDPVTRQALLAQLEALAVPASAPQDSAPVAVSLAGPAPGDPPRRTSEPPSA